MNLLALAFLTAVALVALPDSPVVHEADAMECIINCYVCVTEPCYPPGPWERVEEIRRSLPLPCEVNPDSNYC